MIWSELRAHRNICDAGRSSLMTDGISILHEGSGLNGVSDLSVKLQSGAQRGGTYWVELKLLFSSPSGLSQWPPVPSRSAVQLSAPTHSTSPPNNLHINPWTSRTFPISLSALQQLPSNAGPDNRFTLPASSLSTLGLSNYCQHKQRGRESKNEKRDG